MFYIEHVDLHVPFTLLIQMFEQRPLHFSVSISIAAIKIHLPPELCSKLWSLDLSGIQTARAYSDSAI